MSRTDGKQLYESLRHRDGALVSGNSEGIEKLPDYKRTIDWLLERI